jgi:hypothetical protein
MSRPFSYVSIHHPSHGSLSTPSPCITSTLHYLSHQLSLPALCTLFLHQTHLLAPDTSPCIGTHSCPSQSSLFPSFSLLSHYSISALGLAHSLALPGRLHCRYTSVFGSLQHSFPHHHTVHAHDPLTSTQPPLLSPVDSGHFPGPPPPAMPVIIAI